MALIVVNVAMFLLTYFVPQLLRYLALTPVLVVQSHAWWQVVTYMFLHGGTWHLLFNMLAPVHVRRAPGAQRSAPRSSCCSTS